jgi:hypothetical protein
MYSGRIAAQGAAMAKNLKTPVSFRMTDAELALLDRAAKRFDGNKTKALVEGLKLAAGQNEMSKTALLAEIERRLK